MAIRFHCLGKSRCIPEFLPLRLLQKMGKAMSAICREIAEEVRAVKERDPAAKSDLEVLLLYSGVHAILAYRVSHKLYLSKHYLPARAVSQLARFITGIEIHPGATIGRNFFIDHGSGVVIGETAEIGDNCTLYQGVTLGGTGKDTGKRHPTLGNNVMVGAGAKVLGPFRIGDNSKIAAGAVVLEEIPPDSTAVGIPARVVRRKGERTAPCADMDQVHIPDPVSQQLCRMEVKMTAMEKELEQLKAEQAAAQERAAALEQAALEQAAAQELAQEQVSEQEPAQELVTEQASEPEREQKITEEDTNV